MSAVVIPFATRIRPAPTTVNDSTVHACARLLDLAEAGELSGFAIVGVSRRGSGTFWHDSFGLAASDADACAYGFGKLLRRIGDGLPADELAT